MVRRLWQGKLGMRVLLALLSLILTLIIVPLVRAALTDPCVQGAAPTGCADVRLSDPALIADFYMGDALVAAGVNSARLNVPPSTSVRIEARSVHDTSAQYGDVY